MTQEAVVCDRCLRPCRYKRDLVPVEGGMWFWCHDCWQKEFGG